MTAQAFRWLGLGALAALLSGPASGQDSREIAVRPDLSRRIDALFAKYNVPHKAGGIVAVVHDGQVIHLKGYGAAQREFDVRWTTRDRSPLIDAERAEFVCRALRGIAKSEPVHVVAIGAVATHVHVVARLHPASDLCRLVQRCKGGTSFMAQRDRVGHSAAVLRWARGYNVETITPSAVESVVAYLRDHPRHPPALVRVGPRRAVPEPGPLRVASPGRGRSEPDPRDDTIVKSL